MIDQRIGSLPYELNWIACIPLLLLLFGKQVEDCLSVWLLGHALKKTTVALNVLGSDELIHVIAFVQMNVQDPSDARCASRKRQSF